MAEKIGIHQKSLHEVEDEIMKAHWAKEREIEAATRKEENKHRRLMQLHMITEEAMEQSMAQARNYTKVDVNYGSDEAAQEYYEKITADTQAIGGIKTTVINERNYPTPAHINYFPSALGYGLWTTITETASEVIGIASDIIPSSTKQYGLVGQLPMHQFNK